MLATFAISVTQPPFSCFFDDDDDELWPLIDLRGSAAGKNKRAMTLKTSVRQGQIKITRGFFL